MPDELPQRSPHWLCPASDIWLQPSAPSSPTRLVARGAALDRWLKRTRASAIRSHWKLARRLSLSLKDTELISWFQAAFDEDKLPKCPLKRLLWLIEVRDCHLVNTTPSTRLRINAAIWREVKCIKKDSQNKKLKRPVGSGVISNFPGY